MLAYMEKRLSESAFKGDTESLLQLLQEDPLILDKTIVSCISQTPLHTASTLGHAAFVEQLLILKPELAAELDADGCSPLHVAAAKGHVEIVKKLLFHLGDEACMTRNSDGRTAMHVAVIKGRAAVVEELGRARPELIKSLTDRAETVLHLCVKWCRFEVLKVVVKLLTESTGKDQKERVVEFLNWKDCEGNTALHIAVAKKQVEIINYLLTLNEVGVNALNKNGSTALDILKQSPRDLRDMEIEESLQRAGSVSAKDLQLITDDWVPRKVPTMRRRLSSQISKAKDPVLKHKHTDWLGRKRSALMVVASLIATVAFQSGLTPPGGVWQDDYQIDENGNPVQNPHTVGTSVMAYQEPRAYGLFMIFNTIAFLSSLSIILLLVSGLPIKRRRWMWLQMVTMWISITAQVVTYFITLRHMSPKDLTIQSMLREVTEISVLTWLSLMAVVFIGNVIRMNLWILRKYGYIKEKEREHSPTIEEDEEEL